VSIGIGLITKDGVILATDSQTTGESGMKRFDLPKITYGTTLPSDKLHWGIVQAGNTDLAIRCMEMIQILGLPRKSGHQFRRL